MGKVVLESWTPGLQKVSLTKLLREEAGLSLRAAKRCTDRLLDGEAVSVDVASAEEARRLADEASQLGVVVGELRPQTIS